MRAAEPVGLAAAAPLSLDRRIKVMHNLRDDDDDDDVVWLLLLMMMMMMCDIAEVQKERAACFDLAAAAASFPSTDRLRLRPYRRPRPPPPLPPRRALPPELILAFLVQDGCICDAPALNPL